MKRLTLSISFFVLLVFVLSIPLCVQAQLSELSSGDRIRVTSQDNFFQPVTGIFINMTNDSLAFRIQTKVLRLSIQQIEKLEVIKGKKKNTKKGALIGALTCGLGLGFIAAVDVSQSQDQWFTPSPAQVFAGGVVIGGLGGAGIGALIGSQLHSGKWEVVYIKKPKK